MNNVNKLCENIVKFCLLNKKTGKTATVKEVYLPETYTCLSGLC